MTRRYEEVRHAELSQRGRGIGVQRALARLITSAVCLQDSPKKSRHANPQIKNGNGIAHLILRPSGSIFMGKCHGSPLRKSQDRQSQAQ